MSRGHWGARLLSDLPQALAANMIICARQRGRGYGLYGSACDKVLSAAPTLYAF